MRNIVIATFALPILAVGCVDNSSQQKLNGSGDEEVGKIDIDTSDQPLAAMSLCRSMMPDVPLHLLGSGTSLQESFAVANLANESAGEKSREACEARYRIKQGMSDQQNAAYHICFIETQKGMKAGGKYRLRRTEAATETDAPTVKEISIFLDNSDKDNFRVYTCSAGKLVGKTTVHNAVNGGAKGTYKFVSKDAAGDIQMTGSFDSGVSYPGRQQIASQSSMSLPQNGTTLKFRSTTQLDLSATEISSVKAAFETTSAGDFMKSSRELLAALIGPEFGSSLFQQASEFDESSSPTEPSTSDTSAAKSETGATVKTTRGYFDSVGLIVNKDDAADFKDGGTLDVTESMLPKLPQADFTVGFDPTDWDCSGTVDIELDESSEAYQEFEQKFASTFDQEQCWTDDFITGIQIDLPPLVDERGDLPPPDLGDTPPAQ